MKLVTNFSDYYDHQFRLDGPEFRRVSTEGPDRKEQFDILRNMGLKVIPHGQIREIADLWWDDEEQWIRHIVVYNDLMSHCGEGKEMCHIHRFKWDGCISRLDYIEKCQSLFCSAYCNHMPGVSWRMLQVGPHRFWMEYRSVEDWRSNCGDGSIELFWADMDAGTHKGLDLPLFAVDFALGKKGIYAIDLNVAPGIRGTGVEKYLSPKAMVETITSHVSNQKTKNNQCTFNY